MPLTIPVRILQFALLLAVGILGGLLVAPAPAESPDPPAALSTPAKPKLMSLRATGTFEVKMQPLTPSNDEKSDGPPLGRMSLEKKFSGELDAIGKGEMLTAGSPVSGSAAYVAIERVTGTLGGRKGAFALYHTGVMNRGAADLKVAIVPDSGTGELAGLAGTLTIRVEGGKHFYTVDYSLPGR